MSTSSTLKTSLTQTLGVVFVAIEPDVVLLPIQSLTLHGICHFGVFKAVSASW